MSIGHAIAVDNGGRPRPLLEGWKRRGELTEYSPSYPTSRPWLPSRGLRPEWWRIGESIING